jgi:cytidyltransferase-like protein
MGINMNDELIMYYPGVWDIFHIGHLRALQSCMLQDIRLIVGICSDELNYIIKNKRCINSQENRREIIQSIKGVYQTIIYNDTNYLKHLRHNVSNHLFYEEFFDIFVCGPEFGNREDQQYSLKTMRDLGITIFHTERTPNISTTNIIESIKYGN